MSRLIRLSGLVPDDFLELADDGGPLPDTSVIVSLTRWPSDNETLIQHGRPFGVRLANTVDVRTLPAGVLRASVLVLEFPSFGDGRAYSQARVLRDELNFRGELRATGAAVVRDQLHGMVRCGIDSFELRADQSAASCLEALTDFSLAYQPASDDAPTVRRLRQNNAN